MATEKYPFVTGVRSNLIEEQIKTEQLPPSANTILIFGTATKGPLYTPTRVGPSDVEQIFGENINDPYEKFNLLKGFYEIVGSMPGTEVIAVRIGDAEKASLDLFESQVSSGIYSPQSVETKSLTLTAKSEGLEGNDVIVTVYDNGRDTDATPSRMVIELPNGVTQDFDLINDYTTPSALAAAINADVEVSQYITATPNLLEGSDNITIIEDSEVSGQINLDYPLGQRNLVDITNVYTEGLYTDEDSIQAGRTSASLAKTPIKDNDEFTPTIDKFWTVVDSETLIESAGPMETVQLIRASNQDSGDPKWLAGADSIKDLVITVTNSGGISTVLEDTDYSLNYTTGVITLNSGDPETGSKIKAQYKYVTNFVEANVRSLLESGNPHSYFVAGDTIIFGAGQSFPLEVEYITKTPHTLTSASLALGTIILSLDGNEPAIDDVIKVEYVYNPELPAATGAVATPDGKRQLGQLNGGTTGRKMTGPQAYNALEKGYVASDNIPCRVVVPQGVYVDDVMEGIDFETGLPTTVNAGFHTQLSTYLARHSQYVSECVGIMSVKPMPAVDPLTPTLAERESWYNKLTTISSTDGTNTANVVSAINDYHLVVTAGDLILGHPSVNAGALYVEGAHNLVAAMKLNHDNLSSLITRTVPGGLIRGMQYKIVAADKINKLNEMRYSLITEDSDTLTLKLAAAPTMASATSQFRKQYNLDITIEAINTVRRYVKRFIGQPNKPSVRQAMKRLAEQKLQELSPDKLLNATVNIVVDRNQAISGEAQIDLLLVTAVEIEKINIRTRLELGF